MALKHPIEVLPLWIRVLCALVVSCLVFFAAIMFRFYENFPLLTVVLCVSLCFLVTLFGGHRLTSWINRILDLVPF